MVSRNVSGHSLVPQHSAGVCTSTIPVRQNAVSRQGCDFTCRQWTRAWT